MSFPKDQIDELKRFGSVSLVKDEGRELLLIEDVEMPTGCNPPACDVLLYPHARDGYPTRLFFPSKVGQPRPRVPGTPAPNWHVEARLGGRNWHAYSLKEVPASLRLAQILSSHLRALQ